MSHSWMKANRLSSMYEKGMVEFLKFFTKTNFLTIMKSFIVPVLYVEYTFFLKMK